MPLRQRYSALLGGHSMSKIASLPTIAGALLALGLSAAPTRAGPNRTFVSGEGTDSGACALAAPCRTFAFALTQTAAGGEIDVLDPAGYGAVTITKAVSIVNDGAGVAGIQTVSGANAVTINASASDSLHLRGLTIEGLGSGSSGIRFNTGKSLAIENCVVRNFASVGINIAPSTSSSFSVSNTIASNNPGNGIEIAPRGSAAVKGVLSKVTANNNAEGILMDGRATTAAPPKLNVTIVNSEASNNARAGVLAISPHNPLFFEVIVMVRNVVATNNSEGLSAQDKSHIFVAHSVVTGNGTGVASGIFGAVSTYVDNDIDGNTNVNFGVLTPLAMH
jgi:hypothetical protein